MSKLRQLLSKLDEVFKRKDKKELCDFFSNEIVEIDVPEYQELLKYNPYQYIEQIHLERLNEKYISFTFIYIPSQDYSIYGYKYIIDILEELPPFVFEVSINKKYFNEQHLISMIIFSNYLHLNMYTSMCDYKSVKRISSNLYGSRIINIDLDIYNTQYEDYEDEELYQEMLPYFKQIGIEPSIYINSGHGRYISFILENNINFNSFGMKDLYQKLCKKIIEVLAPFGADAKCSDPTHVFRVPGNINLKTNEEAYIISMDVDRKISLKQLACNLGLSNNSSMVCDDNSLKIGNKVGNNTSKVGNENNISQNKFGKIKKQEYFMRKNIAKSKYSKVNIQRNEDLQRLLELRHYDIVGHRNIFFHILAINCFYLEMEENEVLTYLHSLNNELANPYNSIDIVVNYAKQNYDKYLENEEKAIKYTNVDIVEMLSITKEEQKEMQQLIDREEYKQRRCDSSIPFNEAKNNTRKQHTKENQDILIQELEEYRLKYLATNKDISIHFNMDERTICKLIGKEPKYITIGRMSNDELVIYYSNLQYSNTQISKLMNINERTIRRYRNKLKKEGYTFRD